MALKLTAAGDLSRTDARFDTLDEVTDRNEVIGQRVAIRLRRWLGEWSFDTRLGVDWPAIFEKGTPESVIRARLADQILKVPGVRSLLSLAVTTSTARVATVTGRILAVGADEPVVFAVDVEV